MDVIEAIRTRRSIRQYKTDAIPSDVLEKVTEAMRLAPSACNYQPWRFILVTHDDLRRQVARACHNQMFLAEAPVIVVGCGRLDQAYGRMGGSRDSVEVDVAIAFDHLTLAAAEAGLGTCWIGAFDEDKIKELLDIPAKVKVVTLTPLGYPEREDLLRPIGPTDRKPRSEVFRIDRYE